jgi:hypothetical protein
MLSYRQLNQTRVHVHLADFFSNLREIQMAVISKVVTLGDDESPEYPKIMQSVGRRVDLASACSGLVVLFHAEKRGVVLACSDGHLSIGEYSDCWVMNTFKPFHGTVEVSQ